MMEEEKVKIEDGKTVGIKYCLVSGRVNTREVETPSRSYRERRR